MKRTVERLESFERHLQVFEQYGDAAVARNIRRELSDSNLQGPTINEILGAKYALLGVIDVLERLGRDTSELVPSFDELARWEHGYEVGRP